VIAMDPFSPKVVLITRLLISFKRSTNGLLKQL